MTFWHTARPAEVDGTRAKGRLATVPGTFGTEATVDGCSTVAAW